MESSEAIAEAHRDPGLPDAIKTGADELLFQAQVLRRHALTMKRGEISSDLTVKALELDACASYLQIHHRALTDG